MEKHTIKNACLYFSVTVGAICVEIGPNIESTVKAAGGVVLLGTLLIAGRHVLGYLKGRGLL